MSLIEKILVPLFIVVLKTKRIAKSAVQGKLNHQAKLAAPYLLGTLIAVWVWFVFLS